MKQLLIIASILVTSIAFTQSEMPVIEVLDNMRAQGTKESADKWLTDHFDLSDEPYDWAGCIMHDEEEGQYAVCETGIYLFFTMNEKLGLFGQQLNDKWGMPDKEGNASYYGEYAQMIEDHTESHYLFFSFK
jgi:hypothetical protein